MKCDRMQSGNYCSDDSNDLTVENNSDEFKNTQDQKRGFVWLPSMRVPVIDSKNVASNKNFHCIEEHNNSSSEDDEHQNTFKTITSSKEIKNNKNRFKIYSTNNVTKIK